MRGKIVMSAGAVLLGLALGGSASGDEVMVVRHVFAPSRGWQGCDHWRAARAQNSEDARRLESWALGFASAYTGRLDYAQARKLTLSNDELFSRIDAECRGGAAGIGAAVGDILQKPAAP